jgi:acyl carrier protein
MTTLDTIKQILEENLSIAPEQISEDSTLDSLDIDSLDLVELICDIEDAEGIDFGEPEGLETVGDIVTHIESLK